MQGLEVEMRTLLRLDRVNEIADAPVARSRARAVRTRTEMVRPGKDLRSRGVVAAKPIELFGAQMLVRWLGHHSWIETCGSLH